MVRLLVPKLLASSGLVFKPRLGRERRLLRISIWRRLEWATDQDSNFVVD